MTCPPQRRKQGLALLHGGINHWPIRSASFLIIVYEGRKDLPIPGHRGFSRCARGGNSPNSQRGKAGTFGSIILTIVYNRKRAQAREEHKNMHPGSKSTRSSLAERRLGRFLQLRDGSLQFLEGTSSTPLPPSTTAESMLRTQNLDREPLGCTDHRLGELRRRNHHLPNLLTPRHRNIIRHRQHLISRAAAVPRSTTDAYVGFLYDTRTGDEAYAEFLRLRRISALVHSRGGKVVVPTRVFTRPYYGAPFPFVDGVDAKRPPMKFAPPPVYPERSLENRKRPVMGLPGCKPQQGFSERLARIYEAERAERKMWFNSLPLGSNGDCHRRSEEWWTGSATALGGFPIPRKASAAQTSGEDNPRQTSGTTASPGPGSGCRRKKPKIEVYSVRRSGSSDKAAASVDQPLEDVEVRAARRGQRWKSKYWLPKPGLLGEGGMKGRPRSVDVEVARGRKLRMLSRRKRKNRVTGSLERLRGAQENKEALMWGKSPLSIVEGVE